MLPQHATQTFPYQLERKVGEGAMGIVYRAQEVSLQRPVAIKVLHPEALRGLDPHETSQLKARFLQEARAAASLSHPGVTTIYRVGTSHGTPFIAMEWVDGENLEDLIEREGALEVHRAARIGADMMDALFAAHSAGIVHRDVKPANLMVLRTGSVKVADFGIARIQGGSLVQTQAGFMIGTPMFASPEQFLGKPLDGRSDIFSAGIVLYLTLTNHIPFPGDTPLAIGYHVANTDPVPPHELNPSIPIGLSNIILQALQKNPEHRFINALEMAEALRPFTVDPKLSPTPNNQPALSSGVFRPYTTQNPQLSLCSTLDQLPLDPVALVDQVVRQWPGRSLGVEHTRTLLDRLQERPLHAPPFSGAVYFGTYGVLIAQGVLLAAFDTQGTLRDDEVIEKLPERCEATLYTVPEHITSHIIAPIASLMRPMDAIHKDLDASFVNIPALILKLERESFTGIVEFKRQALQATPPRQAAHLIMVEGNAYFHLFSEGWETNTRRATWDSWIVSAAQLAPIQASVYNTTNRALVTSQRRLLSELHTHIADGRIPNVSEEDLQRSGSAGSSRSSFPSNRTPIISDTELLQQSPIMDVLRWSLTDLVSYFKERKKTSKWKYLASWLDDIHTARLHHNLPRPDGSKSDFFDLVTFREDGFVLHLAHRSASGDFESLESFVKRAIEAKTARIQFGHVGGAIFIAPSFDAATIAHYHDLVQRKVQTGWFYSLQEAFTGYEGFVRIGPKRGFHLLLVQETPDGYVPILPDISS